MTLVCNGDQVSSLAPNVRDWGLSPHWGSKEYARDSAPGPISFISVQFLAKILPNNTFLPKTQGLVPHTLCSGKSWIRHCSSFRHRFFRIAPTVTLEVFVFLLNTEIPIKELPLIQFLLRSFKK